MSPIIGMPGPEDIHRMEKTDFHPCFPHHPKIFLPGPTGSHRIKDHLHLNSGSGPLRKAPREAPSHRRSNKRKDLQDNAFLRTANLPQHGRKKRISVRQGVHRVSILPRDIGSLFDRLSKVRSADTRPQSDRRIQRVAETGWQEKTTPGKKGPNALSKDARPNSPGVRQPGFFPEWMQDYIRHDESGPRKS